MRKMRFNINKLKSFFSLSIITLGLSVSVIRVQAAEQMQETDVEQILSEQDDSVITGVEISTTTMMYAVKKVNVRKEPNTSSEVLGELEPGENIFAVELTDEGWYRVVYAGETGYIRGDFLAVFGDADEWIVSEPETEPIEESDLTEAAEDNKDVQASDNDKAIENVESIDADSDNAAEQPAGKVNIFTILIIVVLIIVIFVYAVIQIVNDNKNPDEDQEDNDEDESDEDDEWDDDESYEDDEWDDVESDNDEPEDEMDFDETESEDE